MTTSKAQISLSVKHINELLKDLGVDSDLSLEWAYSQPRLVDQNGSHVMSMRESKPNMQATLYAIKNVLGEIGRQYRKGGK
tara:strand:- start:498 stop:740 length:243 start_codon:yes stop_codon:yes gene_type:complete